MLIQDYLDICDPVLTFDGFRGGIELEKYLKNIPQHYTGRFRYDPVSMLKTVLFGFMANGYISLRELEDQCKVNLRFMYLMDHQTPSYRTFGYFINEVLADSIKEIFRDINKKIFETEHVDLQHLYIDGSKFEANANKYSWVWKKATEKSRYRLFDKITTLFEEINEELSCAGIKLCINSEYAPEYLKEAAEQYAEAWQIDETIFVHGRGHRKTTQQRHYEKLREYATKLEEYVEKIRICGEERNSYSKTDHSATFMRIKTDYMGNDQLLPAYNVQVGVADEYIAVVDVNQYRSDMDCFIPLMNNFYTTYGFYPKYPVADGLYVSQKVIQICTDNGWDYIIRYKEGCAPTIAQEYQALPEREKTGSEIEYQNQIVFQNTEVNVIYYREKKIQADGEEKITKFAWITNITITKSNAKKIVKAGRNRWKIENQGFNRKKHWQGNIEHACSWNEQVQKNHYLMEQIADFIKHLYEYYYLKKNEIKKLQKNISPELLASFGRQLTKTEDIKVELHRAVLN